MMIKIKIYVLKVQKVLDLQLIPIFLNYNTYKKFQSFETLTFILKKSTL